MSFDDFFKTATGHEPYPYQCRLAGEDPLRQLLNIPTGAGKTAAAILGCLWPRPFASPEVPGPHCGDSSTACRCTCSSSRHGTTRRSGPRTSARLEGSRLDKVTKD